MHFPDSEFWDFSLQTYQIPEVEQTCLKLQDDFDADVNILLFCCWVGQQGLALDKQQIQQLIKATQPWHEKIIKPLRDARKMMKQHIIALPDDMVDNTVENISEIELSAEHMAQLALEKTIKLDTSAPCDSDSAIECSLANIINYSKQLDSIASPEDIMSDINSLLAAVFQDPEAVQMALMTSEALG